MSRRTSSLCVLLMFSVLCASVLLAADNPPAAPAAAKATPPSGDEVKAEAKQMKDEASKDDKVAEFKKSPAGVFDVEYKDGVLLRLKVKGESSVSSALKGVTAVQISRDEAIREAKGKFLQWLNERAVRKESSSEQVIIT